MDRAPLSVFGKGQLPTWEGLIVDSAGCFQLTPFPVKTTALLSPEKGMLRSRTGIPRLAWLGLYFSSDRSEEGENERKREEK